MKSSSVIVNNIHGELNNSQNPLIMGYGDETDERYKQIELLDDNTFFDNIKSFEYSNTTKYHELIDFIQESYEIQIIGHSLGLSDRVLLKMIFENANCKKIFIYYHERLNGSNNYKELYKQISRHFKDKLRQRILVQPFPLSDKIPQIF